ncbi:response regulator transcription factor [Pedobacter sp. L105]|uniref:response regulator transcription factor n=1 Tax=Pedobacter sp. L105 TaxID=1641871 RepID=UPI00131D84EE|nr:response regulator transcription factor [Pedobacter sp. L105]
MNAKILFVEDEPVLAEIVQESLQSRGFELLHVNTLADAKLQYYQYNPQLIILDVMLTDGSGFELARQIRNVDTLIPIIFLTSKSLPRDVVEGFESGGNDYLKKPFSLEELIVRMKALLHKNKPIFKSATDSSTIELGLYTFQYPKGVLKSFGSARMLTTRESEILHLLILQKNMIVIRKDLLINLWGNDDYFSSRSLDVFITKLRRYLKEDPSVCILNIRGQGYKLIY